MECEDLLAGMAHLAVASEMAPLQGVLGRIGLGKAWGDHCQGMMAQEGHPPKGPGVHQWTTQGARPTGAEEGLHGVVAINCVNFCLSELVQHGST